MTEAFITKRGKLKLLVAAPKCIKDRDQGDYLDWDKNFELPVESVLYWEAVDPGFYTEDTAGNKAYRRLVKRGLTIAQRL